MNRKILIGIATTALGLVVLAGCSQSGSTSGYGSSSSSQSATPKETTSGQTALATSESSLGTVVVGGTGKTVYVFDKDTADSGKSACEDACLAKWPPVTTTSDAPKADGVTGTVGMITRTDGSKQVTLNGFPLYYYATDATAGDVQGQGVGGIWWAIGPNGDKITGAATGY